MGAGPIGGGGGGGGGGSTVDIFAGIVLSDVTLGADGVLDLSGLDLSTYAYVDLLFTAQGAEAGATHSMYVRFNADSGNNYDWVQDYTDTGGTDSEGGQRADNVGFIGYLTDVGGDADDFGGMTVRLYDPAGQHSSWRGMSAIDTGTAVALMKFGGNWDSTSAITAISFHNSDGTSQDFASGSRLLVRGFKTFTVSTPAA